MLSHTQFDSNFAREVCQEINDFFYREPRGHGFCLHCTRLTRHEHALVLDYDVVICGPCSIEEMLCYWCRSDDEEGHEVFLSHTCARAHSWGVWECVDCCDCPEP